MSQFIWIVSRGVCISATNGRSSRSELWPYTPLSKLKLVVSDFGYQACVFSLVLLLLVVVALSPLNGHPLSATNGRSRSELWPYTPLSKLKLVVSDFGYQACVFSLVLLLLVVVALSPLNGHPSLFCCVVVVQCVLLLQFSS